MQGWRSIMHGSPEQSSGKRSASACSQKSGLDLAWRLNGTYHNLQRCVAITCCEGDSIQCMSTSTEMCMSSYRPAMHK